MLFCAYVPSARGFTIANIPGPQIKRPLHYLLLHNLSILPVDEILAMHC